MPPPTTANWIVHPDPPAGARERLSAGAGVHPLVAGILLRRGVADPEAARRFLHPRLEDLHDPFLLKGMEEAVERIAAALAQGERIVVSGDYDVDGTASSALVSHFLRAAGATEPAFFIPNRFEHGYGLTGATVEALMSMGPRLVITVDNGITAIDEVARLQAAGIDTIVTDHHLPRESGVPPGIVVNPAQPGCPYPCKRISGCGVAFKLITALRKRLRERGWWNDARPEPNLVRYLDLVAIATVADIVPLTGENRVLVHQGLRELNRPHRRPGVQALLDSAAARRGGRGDGQEQVTARTIGFQIGPRLNAAGRMSEGALATELLLCGDPAEAAKLAAVLERENENRRALGNTMFSEAVRIAEAQNPEAQNPEAQNPEPPVADPPQEITGPPQEITGPPQGITGPPQGITGHPPGIVVSSPDFHEGIIGIVASRLVERFGVPVLVCAENGASCKGSARSVPGLNVTEAIAACGDLLSEYGGHTGAGGCRFPREHLAQVTERFQAACAALAGNSAPPETCLEGRLEPGAIDEALVEQVQGLEPFGHENEEPLFLVEQGTLGAEPEVLKERHLKWRLAPGVEMVAWNQAEDFAAAPGLSYRVRLGFNDYRGRRTIQLTAVDIAGQG